MGLFDLSKEKQVVLNCTMNKEKVSPKLFGKPLITLKQREDGTVYFDNFTNQQFVLIDYEWSGAIYNTVTTTSGGNKSKTKGKTKRKGRVSGALLGTMLMPVVGTAVGALVGTGSKSKEKTKGKHNERTVTSQVETSTPAVLALKDTITGEEINIGFMCNTKIDMQINDLIFEECEEPLEEASKSPVEQMKEYKELLDLGIISQEEFDAKKKELLNL